MTKKETKVLKDELLQEGYLSDLLTNEIYHLLPQIKDSYDFKDIMNIIFRSYCLGKMRARKS